MWRCVSWTVTLECLKKNLPFSSLSYCRPSIPSNLPSNPPFPPSLFADCPFHPRRGAFSLSPALSFPLCPHVLQSGGTVILKEPRVSQTPFEALLRIPSGVRGMGGALSSFQRFHPPPPPCTVPLALAAAPVARLPHQGTGL